MVCESFGLNPERFNSIQTPPIFTANKQALANDGLPSYARLDVLIAYLTAPTTINYDTLNDFLSTHKLFSDDLEVWNLAVSRLLWAANLAARTGSETESGKNIGTRCFVLLRLWIRVYFEIDFVPNLDLRRQVSKTLTCLSGCAEFVLIDHFQRILRQLRSEWDEKVARYWTLGRYVTGDDDSPVPVGDEPIELSKTSSMPQRRVLGCQIPIDANVSVPRIHSSPSKAKPRHKISMFFKRQRNEASNEVVLHSKADLLSMRIIDEYRQRELREFASSSSSVLSNAVSVKSLRDRYSETDKLIPGHLIGEAFSKSIDQELSRSDDLRHPAHSNRLSRLRSTRNTDSVYSDTDRRFETEASAVSAFDDEIWATPQPSSNTSYQTEFLSQTDPDIKISAHSKCIIDREQSTVTLNLTDMNLENSGESETEKGHNCELSDRVTSTVPQNSAIADTSTDPGNICDSQNASQAPVSSNTADLTDPLDTDTHVAPCSHGTSMTPEVPEAPDSVDVTGPSISENSYTHDTTESFKLPRSTEYLESSLISQNLPVNLDYIDFEQFERVSHEGSALSTLSSSTQSTFSYHAPNLDSSRNFSNIPKFSDDSISLMSEIDNSQLLPCVGYTASHAAKLRAIPDLDVGEDALRSTLERLEGVISASKISQIPRSNTIELYSQALGSCDHQTQEQTAQNEISQLGISLNHATPTHSYQNTLPTQLSSPFKSGAGYNFQTVGTSAALGDAHLSETYRSNGLQRHTTPRGHADIPSPLPTLKIGLPGATHAPFILAFSARAVAEQMTIIECEVLWQLDWTELVRMVCPRNTRKIYSWLNVIIDNPNLKATELVDARFELVYRWVQSEILLCPTPALQAQAISRFVHISFESLKLRNFATMVQLVRALCSIEVQSKLNPDVYKLLPQYDRETLERLETLANPIQNYAKLRQAHERFTSSRGCVPYTKMFFDDIELTSKAQSLNAENEIHFGKYRTISQIVKQLKQYVDSTANYKLDVEHTLLSKCLYLCATP